MVGRQRVAVEFYDTYVDLSKPRVTDFHRGIFSGLTSAAKRRYSARTALCFSLLDLLAGLQAALPVDRVLAIHDIGTQDVISALDCQCRGDDQDDDADDNIPLR
jgi:hypothetical protein